MKPNAIQIIVVVSIAILTAFGLGTMCWCAIFKIYIEPTMMISLNGITFGLGGSLTTILVGRTISQLNQTPGTETTMEQTTKTTTKAKADAEKPQEVIVKNEPSEPVPTTEETKP